MTHIALGLIFLNSLMLLGYQGYSQNVLWYTQPAKDWNEALPIGNGRIGAMIFGHPAQERIQLNDDSLWPDDLGWAEPEGTPQDLSTIRELLFNEKHAEADRLFVEKFSNKSIIRSHQTLGDLYIDLNHDEISQYRRSLDLKEAITTTSFHADGYEIRVEAFASHPDRCIAIRYTSARPEGISGRLRLNRPQDQGHPTIQVKAISDNCLVMKGQVTQMGGMFRSEPSPIRTGVSFETRLFTRIQDGTIQSNYEFLEFQGVSTLIIYIVSNSSFYVQDYGGQNDIDSLKLSAIPYEQVKQRHIEDYQELFNRVDLTLGAKDTENIPTDQRLTNIRSGKLDLGLEALLFQYGRYLLISSSRPGTNPANLQGLWNHHIQAPWNADYHLNINLQMNYWPADVTNLSELNAPFFEYTDRLIENGKRVAMNNFGCGGAFVPHATDLWAPAWLRAPTAYWGCSVGAGGWLMQHYFDHFRFTRDTSFLSESVLPVLEQVAHFYSDWLITDPRDGMLVSAPSTSPENRFIHPNGDTVATCLGSAMDQQVIFEVFSNYIETCKILDIKTSLLETIKNQLPKLRPGFVLSDDGRILEWDRDYQELEPGHRHMSHLYGFHPGNQITENAKPKLFDAVRKSLDYRLENGGAGTGWSRAWLINCSARLLDGDMAHEHIQKMFQKSMFINLFDAHPPFQIDGNFGYTAGIAEMLIQSHENDIIRVLPALPSAWRSGSFKGIKARGGYTLDMEWLDGGLQHLSVYSKYGGEVKLLYDQVIRSFEMSPGEQKTIHYSE